MCIRDRDYLVNIRNLTIMRRVGSYIISLFKEWIIIGRPWFGWSREWQYHMDTARDNAGRLVEHANNAAASSWPAVAGPDIPWFLPLAHNLSKVERYTSKHGEISTKRVLLHVYTTLFFFGGIWGGGYLYYGMCSKFCGIGPVSYTHLTLPTIYSV